MRTMKTIRLLLIAVGMPFLLFSLAPAGEETQVRTQPEYILLPDSDIKWADGPASMSPGSKFAVLEGDPKSPGPVTMRIKLPANYTLAPHTHPGDERVTVLSGTLFFALGDKVDRSKAKELPAGSFFVIPSGKAMFGFTKEETVIQINVLGPWGITYLNPADDPRKK